MAEDIKKLLIEQEGRIKRHFDVVAEDLKSDIQIVAEQVATNAEKLTAYDQKFEQIIDDMDIIKLDIEFIKSGLQRKVDYEEFSALEKRVSMLESKTSR